MQILFLHGYLSNKESFNLQKRFFKNKAELHLIDLTGFGENKEMPYPYSLDDYVREVKDYIIEKGLIKPNVIAHSFGGRVAIKLSATEPKLLGKLVLVGSAGLKPRRGLRYRLRVLKFKILKKFLPKEKLKKYYSSDYNSLSPIMQQSFIKIVNEHLNKYLNKIKTTTLIINGENDKETPLYMAKKLHRGIRDSEIRIIKNAGHFCFIEKFNEFNLIVNEFLFKEQNDY